MKRGLRYLPAPRRGRRRLGLVGLGLLAALTLVWQQQATLATFIDAEHAKATFTAARLSAITPTFTTTAAKATGTWTAASGSWATPNYVLTGATTSDGGNAAQAYSGSALTYTQTVGSTSTSADLKLNDITVGGTHACGIARGTVFCWGGNANGQLGVGNTTATAAPTAVRGALAGKVVTDVSAGTSHTCAVVEGSAYCWGLASNGRLGNGSTASANVTSPVQVNAGAMSGTVDSISAGAAHTCAVADGNAYCWGNGNSGRLGSGNATTVSSPVAVLTSGVIGGRTVTSISAGNAHSCAVAEGLAFCWGLGTNGRLGNSSTSGYSPSPVAVDTTWGPVGHTVTVMAAGNTHSCAVVDGTAYCWGSANSGRLGIGATSGDYDQPVAVTSTLLGTGSVTAINAGNNHSCAIAAGKAYCWGYNNNGQVGDNSTTQRNTPVAVNTADVLNGRAATAISAGTSTSCVLGDDFGSCWGLGTSGQLGNGLGTTSRVPVDAPITGQTCPEGAVRISATECSLQQGTEYWAQLGYSIGSWTAPISGWENATTKTRGAIDPEATQKASASLTLGWSEPSELGDSYGEYTLQRSKVPSGSGAVTVYQGASRRALDSGGFPISTANLPVSQVSAGSDYSCGLLDGSAYCWGDNATGELGIGSTADATVPTSVVSSGVLSDKTVTAISTDTDDGAGDAGQHTCVVADGGVYCWGLNTNGELGDGSTTQRTTPVQAGTITGATAVAAGYMHTCALAGGKAYCWGDNSRGQLGDGSTTRRTSPVVVQGLLAGKTITAIAAGAAHTCAVADGAAYCWGSNVSGQLGLNTLGGDTNSSVPVAVKTSGVLNGLTVTAVAAGEAHSCALAAGKAYCWGYNNVGQVGNNTTTTSPVAVAVSASWATGATLTSLSAGQYGTCVLASGKAYCWGEGGNGQLGNGGTNDQRVPVAVTTSGVLSGTVDQISAGTSHGCATSGDAAYCWGLNSEGRLGNGGTNTSNVPVTVQAVSAPSCPTGANLITPMTCSLKPSTTYYYRLTYTVDGGMSASSGWVGIKTS